jgi:hypothetical protein
MFGYVKEIAYHLDQDTRDKIFVETGVMPNRDQKVVIEDPQSLTPDQRQALVACRGTTDKVTLKQYEVSPPSWRDLPQWPPQPVPSDLYTLDRIKRTMLSQVRSYLSPRIKETTQEFDHPLTVDEAIEALIQTGSNKAKADLDVEYWTGVTDQWNVKIEAYRQQVQANCNHWWKDIKVREKAEAEARRQELCQLPWDEHEVAIVEDLSDRLFEVAGLEIDSRFESWVMRVEGFGSVDQRHMRVGEFLTSGTVEISRPDRPVLYLLGSTLGSNQYHYRHYRVVVLGTDVQLHPTDFADDNSKSGVNLRIKQFCEPLLAQFNS